MSIVGDRLIWSLGGGNVKVEYQFKLGQDKGTKTIDLTLRSMSGVPKPAKDPRKTSNFFLGGNISGKVFPGSYILTSQPWHEDNLELFFNFHPDHLGRPSKNKGGHTNVGWWTVRIEMTRLRSDAERKEYLKPDASGVSMAERRAVDDSMNREIGAEHEPRYLLWEGAELTDTKGVKRKIIRVKYFNPDLKKEQDELHWVDPESAKGETGYKWWPEWRKSMMLPNTFGNDWKAKAADLKWSR